MKVVLAEKPSVARDLARHLRADSKRDGYLEGSGYQVTWALGHLVGLKEPGDYQPAWKKWSFDALPMLPEAFQLCSRGDTRARKQLSVVTKLFQRADEIICATDAGREGELIFRYVLQYAGCESKPAMRLWLKSLTPQAIRTAFQDLRPLADYDSLYAAARCRSEADWIVGMNATRFYTLTHGSTNLLFSIGRVQTPLLAMIVRRDEEIDTFQPKPFWELTTVYRETTFRHEREISTRVRGRQSAVGGERSTRFDNQEAVEALLKQVQGHEFQVKRVQRKPQKLQPPQLFDLTELQRDANRRFGLSAAKTLQIAQALYEKKLISYPRTDSRYLSSDLKSQVPKILDQLRQQRPHEISKLDTSRLRFPSRIINDRKVDDHHAIIPTGAAPSGLSEVQRKIYDAIVIRLIAAFYPHCEKEVSVVDGESNRVPFRARGVRVVTPGWTELYPRKSASGKDSKKIAHGSDPEEEQELASFREGEQGPHRPAVRQGETTPPKRFTENTLLGAMETAGKLVDDEELREALKEKGLGTPATRAAMIETLLQRGYVERAGKQLQATDLGRYLIARVRHPRLKSPELTGDWEAKLKQVEQGRGAAGPFMDEIAHFAQKVTAVANQSIEEEDWGQCPKCGAAIMQGKRGFGCSAWREGCSFVLWPTYGDIALSHEQVRELLHWGATGQPVTTDTGSQALLSLVRTGAIAEVPLPGASATNLGNKSQRPRSGEKAGGGSPTVRSEQRPSSTSSSLAEQAVPLGECPLCSKPVVDQKKSYSCSDWKAGCKFVIWKTMAGKRISTRSAKRLITHGETSLLKGFKSRAGRKFDARLKLVDGKVEFDFETR